MSDTLSVPPNSLRLKSARYRYSFLEYISNKYNVSLININLAYKAEVGKFAVVVVRDKDILTLDISVDDVQVMEVVQRKGNLTGPKSSFVLGNTSSGVDMLEQISTFRPPREGVEAAPAADGAVDLHQVRVPKCWSGVKFAREKFEQVFRLH